MMCPKFGMNFQPFVCKYGRGKLDTLASLGTQKLIITIVEIHMHILILMNIKLPPMCNDELHSLIHSCSKGIFTC